MNFSHNFGLYGIESPHSANSPYQNINLANYQQLFYPQYFLGNENYFIQTTPLALPFGFQPFMTTDFSFIYSKSSCMGQKVEQDEFGFIQTPEDEQILKTVTDRYMKNQQNLANISEEGSSIFSHKSQNGKFNQNPIEKQEFENNKCKNELDNSNFIAEKQQFQNIRYQRKNIEANVVNKIYTYLKTCFKLGQKSTLNLLKNKEKAHLYYKVLEKLQKTKKQNIKREFLKRLISIKPKFSGYNKIAKELLKKGERIQQFEYYIRVIIKNYLRTDATNSILTSKKMNPYLWKDHIQKIRQLEQFLFCSEESENIK